MRKLIAALTVIAVLAISGGTAVAGGSGGGHWWCNPTEVHGDGHHGSHHYPDPKGPLSREDCGEVKADLRAAKRYARQYPTAADAVDAGYRKIVPYVQGMGAHYISNRPLNEFDPTRPTFLLYGGNGPDAPLVGLMYTSFGTHPPEGFAGDNDHWHTHDPLCMVDGLIVAEGLSDEECRARGGFNINVDLLWMVHVWIMKDWTYKPDIFRAHHPDLGPTPPT